MAHAQRAQENLAFDVAVHAANDLGLPLVVTFRLGVGPPDNDMRHSAHMLAAFPELVDAVRARGAAFALFEPADLPTFVAGLETLAPAVVICDDDAMPHAVRSRSKVADALSVPLVAVDADVVVPSRVFEKRQYAAATLRPRYHRVLHEFADERGGRTAAHTQPPARRPNGLGDGVHWFTPDGGGGDVPVGSLEQTLLDAGVPDLIGRVDRPSGTTAARARLRSFIEHGLVGYAERRNQPHLDGTSGLSVFLHFGQISPHRVLGDIRESGAPKADIDSFVEEFTVRRELAVNFLRYAGSTALSLDCAADWAKESHARHGQDTRDTIFTEEAMVACATHDPLWNAAQRQMMEAGTMHGYLRMYWAKQILTWTASPEQAYDIALRLHDRYSMDGRDPNSVTGVAWAIAGVHDRAWPSRPVFGKIRSMTFASTSRKFDSKAYIARWSGGEQASLFD